MFKEERSESLFDWNMIGDIETGRPNLGSTMTVVTYLLMQFTLRDVMIQELGVERAEEIFYKAGRRAGEQYYENVLGVQPDLDALFAQLQGTLKDLGIGIFRVESADIEADRFVVTVAEDLDCSGIPVCSEQVCTYDEGFLAGVLHAFNGHEYRVKEVDCWGSGDRVCRFTVDPA